MKVINNLRVPASRCGLSAGVTVCSGAFLLR